MVWIDYWYGEGILSELKFSEATLRKYFSLVLTWVTYLLPIMNLKVFYRRKYCSVVQYIGKGREIKYIFLLVSILLKLFFVCFISLYYNYTLVMYIKRFMYNQWLDQRNYGVKEERTASVTY